MRIWSKKIVQVLKRYDATKNIIFGITGDIDNLGIFVSEYGRPLTENIATKSKYGLDNNTLETILGIMNND